VFTGCDECGTVSQQHPEENVKNVNLRQICASDGKSHATAFCDLEKPIPGPLIFL
jgi:hypothetical protein